MQAAACAASGTGACADPSCVLIYQPMADATPLRPAACPNCQGTGWEQTRGGGVRRCRCTLDSKARRLLERSGIPPRYEHCDLSNYKPNNESQRQALFRACKLVELYPLVDFGILFLGPCGVGKTHLAVGIIKQLIIEKGVPCLFYDFRELIRCIQNSYDPESEATEGEILAPVLSAEVLVLDELGASKSSAWVEDMVNYIINRRYNDKRVTIFTSNFMDERLEPRDQTLAERIGARMRSRLYEMCVDVVIHGEDFRQHIRQARYRFDMS